MVDLVNLIRCEKISGKVDQPKHKKRFNNIPSLFHNVCVYVYISWCICLCVYIYIYICIYI